jgi:hypothetical protein
MISGFQLSIRKQVIDNLNFTDMKSTGKILMMSLLLLLLGVIALNAQRPERGMRMDTTRMHRMMADPGRMPLLMNNPDSLPMRGMRHGMRPGPMMHGMWGGMGPGHMMSGMHWGMQSCPMMGRMRYGMRPMPMNRMGQPGPGMRMLENIPNLTEKQKKEIADLRLKHQDEMKKLRDEMSSKMKSLRDAQKAKMMGLLTDEQKKWVEENTPKAPESPEKVK